MRHYSAKIKEFFNEHVLTPSYYGQIMSVEQLINLWGLNESDIEWYELYENFENGKSIKISYRK